jgi:hypothetical protein
MKKSYPSLLYNLEMEEQEEKTLPLNNSLGARILARRRRDFYLCALACYLLIQVWNVVSVEKSKGVAVWALALCSFTNGLHAYSIIWYKGSSLVGQVIRNLTLIVLPSLIRRPPCTLTTSSSPSSR